ncbi:autorepressor SdpR family transcription factor [Alloalcanivorax gelatiniphagus]
MTVPILDDPLEAALKTLSEPNRLQILRLISRQEMSSGEIAAHFDVHRTGICRHLTVLKEAGLARQRRRGNERLYRLDAGGLRVLHGLLEELSSTQESGASTTR